MIPRLTDDNLSGLTWHIRGITALAIAVVVVVGALVRLGGLVPADSSDLADTFQGAAPWPR